MVDVEQMGIAGPQLITPTRHRDSRGFLSEVYNARDLVAAGIDVAFVQENHILTHAAGTIRGLHYQAPPATAAKLVRVVRGSIFDVAVDLRPASPTYGDYASATLSADNWHQMFIPVGFAHGFCTLEPDTEIAYLVSAYWHPDADGGLAWDDPDLAIDWPLQGKEPVLSPKDSDQPAFADLPQNLWNDE